MTVSGFKGIFKNKYVTMCAAFSTLGGILFGYDQGVVSVTLVMEQFLQQFPEVADGASGAGFKKGLLTAMIELGAFIGAMNQGWIADKISRKWSIMVAVLIFLLGSALQTGSMNYSMLVAARFIGGIGVGMLAMVAPLYISEIAPPEIRGTLLVFQELSIVTAIVVAFYITYGTRYIASEWSWRLPFLIQVNCLVHTSPSDTYISRRWCRPCSWAPASPSFLTPRAGWRAEAVTMKPCRCFANFETYPPPTNGC
jgi:MFS family permease